MVLKKLKFSISAFFEKDTEASSPSKEPKTGLKMKAERAMDSLLGYNRALKKLEAKILMEEALAKGRSQTDESHNQKPEKKPPEDLLCCPICFSNYTRAQDPFVGNCGHTLCRICVRSLRTYDCPLCRKECAFISPSKNFLAFELLGQTGAFDDNDEVEPDNEPVVPNGMDEDTDDEDFDEEDGLDDFEIEEESDLDDFEGDLDDFEIQEDDILDDPDFHIAGAFDAMVLLQMRSEIVRIFRAAPAARMRLLEGRYDLMWHLIMAYSLRGRCPDSVKLLQETIPSTSPHYQELKLDAGAMLRWGFHQRMGRRPTDEELKKFENWPGEPSTAGNSSEEVPEEMASRLRMLLILSQVYSMDYIMRYESILANQTQLEYLHWSVQFFEYSTVDTIVDHNYIVPWNRPG